MGRAGLRVRVNQRPSQHKVQAHDSQDEAEHPDWEPLIPTGLEVAQQAMRVDSSCSTTHDTWLDENAILYNVSLTASRETGCSGLPALLCLPHS